MSAGWVKLYRQSMDSSVFRNPNLWQVWCYCLMRANHTSTKIIWNSKELTLEPGQFLTGRFEGAKDCSMKPSTFRNQLALLSKLENLDIKSDSKASLITVLNWSKFQQNEAESDSGRTAGRTTEGQQKDTDKNVRMEEPFFRCEFFSLSEQEFTKYLTAFHLSREELVSELQKMNLWLEQNPSKRKKNYQRFIFNWLSRRAEARPSAVPAVRRFTRSEAATYAREHGLTVEHFERRVEAGEELYYLKAEAVDAR